MVLCLCCVCTCTHLRACKYVVLCVKSIVCCAVAMLRAVL